MLFFVLFLSVLAQASPADDALSHRVTKAFSLRDGAPSCADIQKLGSDEAVRNAVHTVANTVTMPPWVPMRAARCVALNAQSDPASWATIQQWMSNPETAGFALVVMQNVDHFGAEKAERLGELAVQRASADERFARLVRPSMLASKHGAVVKLSARLQ